MVRLHTAALKKKDVLIMKILKTLKIPFDVCLSNSQINLALELTSVNYVGTRQCNMYDKVTYRVVSKPEVENHPNYKKLEDAHRRVHHTTRFYGVFNLMEDGSLEIK